MSKPRKRNLGVFRRGNIGFWSRIFGSKANIDDAAEVDAGRIGSEASGEDEQGAEVQIYKKKRIKSRRCLCGDPHCPATERDFHLVEDSHTDAAHFCGYIAVPIASNDQKTISLRSAWNQ
jgi:hypothetical protein